MAKGLQRQYLAMRKPIYFGLLAIVVILAEAGVRLAGAEPDPLEINEGGYVRRFEIFSNAVSPQANRQRPKQLVLYEKGVAKTAYNRRVVKNQVLVRLAPGTDAETVRSKVKAVSVKQIPYAGGYFVFEASDPADALRMGSALHGVSGVTSADPVLGKKYRLKFVPNDPLFNDEWNLLNQGQFNGLAGIDLKVTNVWERFRGTGVTIAIVDNGLQVTHPDLISNCNTNLQYDYRDRDNDPSPGDEDIHGTAVAGVAAAAGNNGIGVAGVAFEASLVGVRLVGGEDQTDEQNAEAMLHQDQAIQISNNSWGADDTGDTLEGAGPLMAVALETAVKTGRNGLGTIFVWAAGNGAVALDNVNYDGYANSPYVIAAGSANDFGFPSSYSEPGACLLVSVPAEPLRTRSVREITTTDLQGENGFNGSQSVDLTDIDYTRTFGGTSAAAPMVSGVVALMLQANPNLGWRDVQEILVRSSTQTDVGDPGWRINGAGFHFHPRLGAGLANADSAVRLAERWTNLGPQTLASMEFTNLNETIPDNDTAGVTHLFDFRSDPRLRVEHVIVTATIQHSRRGDLAIVLTSPSGMESQLAERHFDNNADYPAWKFNSVFHWGETSYGQWKINVSDQRATTTGLLKSLKVQFMGAADVRPILIPLGINNGQFQFRLLGAAGSSYHLEASTDLSHWTPMFEVGPLESDSIDLTQPNPAVEPFRYFRALLK